VHEAFGAISTVQVGRDPGHGYLGAAGPRRREESLPVLDKLIAQDALREGQWRREIVDARDVTDVRAKTNLLVDWLLRQRLDGLGRVATSAASEAGSWSVQQGLEVHPTPGLGFRNCEGVMDEVDGHSRPPG
jgi:hypothetical protein